MLKNKKGLLILIFSLIIIYFVINIIYVLPSGKKFKNTVFLGDITKVKISNNKLEIIDENTKIRPQEVKIYFKNKFIDASISTIAASDGIKYSYIASNNEGKNYITGSVLIAHTPDISIKIKETDYYESKDLTDIYELAKSDNISIGDYFGLDYQEISSADVDEDGKVEYIYSVGLTKSSGAVEEDDEAYEDVYDSFVFIKKDNKYFLIDRIESDGDPVTYTKLSFAKLIDFNNDGEYEFVIEKMMSEYGLYNYELYNFDGKEFTKIGGE